MKHLQAQPETVHWGYFSKNLAPVLRISSGEAIGIETLSYPRGQNLPELRTQQLDAILEKVTDVGPGPHLLTGPIFIEDARPGDVLAVHVEDVEPLIPYGYNIIRPGKEGFGAIPGDFPEGRLKVLKLDLDRRRVLLTDQVSIPLRPFFGIVGVAPSEHTRWDSRIPGPFGGNIDIKELVAGTTLYLPIWVQGALLSIGDGHAAQGDGEVDLSAVETSMRGQLRLEVCREFSLERPMLETPTHFITTGFHEDLDEAVKIATRDMIHWLCRNHGLNALDAYTLCSLALNLRVSQVVNIRKGIHAMLAKETLEG